MGALDGKVAIIVGGTSGIGARTAEVFVNEGAAVVIAGRRTETGEALAGRLGPMASFVRADASNGDDLKALIEGAAAGFGRIDTLFNQCRLRHPRSVASPASTSASTTQ